MAEELAIARWSGVTSIGNEKWPNCLWVIEPEPGAKGSIVVQTPDVRYRELFVAGTAPGTLQHRAAPGGDFNRAATYGDNKIVNCAVFLRSLTNSQLVIPKDDAVGTRAVVTVSDLGGIGIGTPPTTDPRSENISIVRGKLEPNTRVWIKSAPGTPSGLILQSPNRTPWVIWVNAADALKTTTWEDFRLGV